MILGTAPAPRGREAGRAFVHPAALPLVPDLPGRPAARPLLFQQHLVAQGVHALPVALVPVRAELAPRHEALQRRLLPDRRIAVDEIEHFRLADEEAAVDEAAVAGLLLADGLPIGRAAGREKV